MNLPMLTRAQLLGQIMRNYDTPVAVAGTHGKTTTTSMLSHILLKGDCDPTISVGGILPAIGGNIRVGQSETFLTEACEYTNSFLSFFPKISIILNIDADHLDFFKDIEDIRCSFRKFAELLPENGTLIINADTPQYEKSQKGCPARYLPTVWSMRQIIQLLILPITSLAMPPLLYAIKDRLLAPAPSVFREYIMFPMHFPPLPQPGF